MRWEIIWKDKEDNVYNQEWHEKMSEAKAAFNKYYDNGCAYVELHDTHEYYDSIIYDGGCR